MTNRRYITTALIHITLAPGEHGNKNLGKTPLKPENAEIPAMALFPKGMTEADILELGIPKRAFREIYPGEDIRLYAEMTDLSVLPSRADVEDAHQRQQQRKYEIAQQVHRDNMAAQELAGGAGVVTHVDGKPVPETPASASPEAIAAAQRAAEDARRKEQEEADAEDARKEEEAKQKARDEKAKAKAAKDKEKAPPATADSSAESEI